MPDEPMPNPASAPVHKMELVVSWLLRLGVSISLVIVVLGTVVTFLHHSIYLDQPMTTAELLTRQKDFPHTLAADIRGLQQFNGRSIVILGLLLLIATPVLRVAVSVIAFALQRDRKFVAITTVVLLLLLLSFLLGKAGG